MVVRGCFRRDASAFVGDGWNWKGRRMEGEDRGRGKHGVPGKDSGTLEEFVLECF